MRGDQRWPVQQESASLRPRGGSGPTWFWWTGTASLVYTLGCLLRVDASCCRLDRGVRKASSITLMLEQVQNLPENHLIMTLFEAR